MCRWCRAATNGPSGRNCGPIFSIASSSRTGMCSPVPPPQTGNRWKPTWVIQASIALHAGAAIALLARPRLWPWLLGAVVADHLILTAAGLWPRSKLLGPNWTHLPAAAASNGSVAITIDDGPDPRVTPLVLDLLDRHSAKATFFCIGELVEQHSN